MVDWVADTWQIASRARWWAGPIFDKELRVTSRRRRYYLLRFAYVSLLVLVTLRFWYASVHVSGGASPVLQVSRLAQAGKGIIVTVVWFQFIAGQVLAAVLLSDAISSEIRQRTLESLLVTPIGAVHIVLGKLLSRLLQLVLLLAISLPVLAVVRVFGGVPWDYVVSSLCITLSGAVFAGSMSLLYSITYRHAYQAVLVVGLWYLVVWVMFAMPVMSLSAAGYLGYAPAVYVISLIDPIPALVTRTQMLLGAASGRNMPAPLLLHCLTILTAASAILALAVRRVRRATLAYENRSSRGLDADWRNGRLESRRRGNRDPKREKIAFGNPTLWLPFRGQARGPAPTAVLRPRKRGTPNRMRRVEGQPIVWRELRAPLLGVRKRGLFTAVSLIVVAVFIQAVAVISGPAIYTSSLASILVLHGLFIIRLAAAAAGAVTREKEARTWSILLATPLENAEIVKGKAFAALRRNAWLLAPLMVLYLVVALDGPAQGFPRLVLPAYAGLAGTVVFLLGLGLYLSTRLKTTTGAVIGTLGLYFVPKLFFCGISGPWLLLAARGPLGAFQCPVTGTLFAVALVSSVIYAAVGLLCLRAATRRLRRDVF